MKNLNSFYLIGTIGTVLTAVLHIILAVVTANKAIHPVFIGIYPALVAFMVIGAAQMKKTKNLIPVKNPIK